MQTSQTDLERTRAYVKSVAMKYVRNEQDADDVAQDAMLLAHRYRESFRGESRYSTWLYRVTATAALMFLRKQRRLAIRSLGVDLGSPLPNALQDPCAARKLGRSRAGAGPPPDAETTRLSAMTTLRGGSR